MFAKPSKRTLVNILAAAGTVGSAAAIALILVYLTLPGDHESESSPANSPNDKKADVKKVESAWQPGEQASELSFTGVQLELDGTLKAGDQKFKLYGITIPPRNFACNSRTGEPWACGLRAYVALLNFIGSAMITCKPMADSTIRAATCRRGEQDISEWMLENGWALIENGVTEKRYIDAAGSGRSAKAGIWADAPKSQAK